MDKSNAIMWKSWYAIAMILIAVIYTDETNAATCTTMDQQVRSQYSQAALNALMAGDLNKYQNLEQSLPEQLSTACRDILDQQEPMRVKCTDGEKKVILQHYASVMQAVSVGDLGQIFALMDSLENKLSSSCWIASNRHTEPRVVQSCTGSELDHIASYTGPYLRALATFLSTGDASAVLQVSQAAIAPLSPNCKFAIAQTQHNLQQNPVGANGAATPYRPNNVYDHGGGTYSVPGVGACTPSECMAFE